MSVKIILIIMVRNESKIIERCLSHNCDHADVTLIVDTGSSDNTVELCKKYTPHVISDTWIDFGTNRTLSFNYAIILAKQLYMDLSSTYALLLDADMLLHSKPNFKTVFNDIQPNYSAYDLYQINGNIEYANKRVLRLGDPWQSVGVTHEYWSFSTDDTQPLSIIDKKLAYIEDVNDGGCKSDKYQRDLILLNTGLDKDPENSRYTFYKANTLKDMKSYSDAISWYKKRINMKGWDEEIWYSYYMIAKCYLLMKRFEKAEKWAQRAFHYRPERIEPLMMLVRHFRESFNPRRAWHYLTIASVIQKTTDILFVESDSYDVDFDYEQTLLWYYIYTSEKQAGMCHCINYLNKYNKLRQNIVSNLKYYAEPLENVVWKQFEFPVDDDYISSSLSVSSTGMMNVRAVNYFINDDGGFIFDEKIDTKNYCSWYDPKTKEWSDFNLLVIPSSLEKNKTLQTHVITGLEDIRINGDWFTANTLEYSYTNSIRVVVGKYPSMSSIRVLKPPVETTCEKNWILLDPNNLIYNWHPLQIASIPSDDNKIKIHTEIDSPKWLEYARGSTTPFVHENQLWLIVHLVSESDEGSRNYLHAWLVLDKNSYKVLGYSLPFTFQDQPIEYCTGAQLWKDIIHMFVSFWDRESWVGTKSILDCIDEMIWIDEDLQ